MCFSCELVQFQWDFWSIRTNLENRNVETLPMGRVAPPPLLKKKYMSIYIDIYIVDINMHDIQLYIHVQCIFVTGLILTQPNGFFQHQSLSWSNGSLIFERVGQLIWPWTTCYWTIRDRCCKNTLRKWLGGWWMPHFATCCLVNLDELELIFSVEKLQNSAVVSLAFSIKPTSSAKNRLRFCLFPFHAAKFSICVPRWIQIHLLRTALVFSLPPTVSSSHLATRELPLVEFDHPQGKRADGWMKTADGKYQKFGVHKAMKNDGGKCQVFLGWQICADDGIVKTTLP